MATPRANAKNTVEDMKAALKSLFEEEYYSKQFRVQKWLPNEEDFGLYVPLKSSDGIDLQQKILEDISKPVGPLSTLVLGDSGTGKSWLALKLTKHLYDSSEEQFQNKIPLYIPLGKIENMKRELPSSSKSDILWSYIKFHSDSLIELDSDLKFENFYKKLCKAELILILDGFDELEVKVNLWETNEWTTDRFSDRLCTIVFCRPSALLDIDFSKMFGFYRNRKQHIPNRYNISLLDKKLVENYISQVPQFLSKIKYDADYDSQNMRDPTWMMTKSVTSKHGNCKWESSGEDSEYKDWFFVKLPELQRLARNIYILKIICQLLPKLVEQERIRTGQNKTNDEFMGKLEEICRTEVLLYDKFTEAWFTYQVDRFKVKPRIIENLEGNCAEPISDIKSVLVHYMVGYAQNLAMRYARLNVGKISNGEIPASETLYWNLWTPWNPNSETFSRDRKLENELFPNNEKDMDEHRVANLKFLRDSCLLRYSSYDKSFNFMHLSLFEYFLSREVFEKFRGALNYYSNWERRQADELYFPINQRNINDSEFSGILSNLVGRAKVDEHFQSLLLETVKKSATLPGIEQMASNALTILNLSGFSFSGKMTEDDNFQNIQVPGTNFKNSICGNSDFSGANFKDAKFSQGWFQGCKFQGVNFSKCSFGQIAPISLDSKTCHVLNILCFAEDEFYYVVVCYYEPCRSEKVVDLYIKNYKLTTDFEQQECKLICLDQQLEYNEYYFRYFLTKGCGNVFLFIFSGTQIQLTHGDFYSKVPKYWYEFNFDSKLASNETKVPAFDRDSFLEFMNSSKYTQKFILFYSINRNPEFCDMERFKREAESRQFPEKTKLYCNKYFWMPFGNIKLLVSVRYKGVQHFSDANILESIKLITLLHNEKPTVLLQESSFSCFEIFWQTVEASGIQQDMYWQEFMIYDNGNCYNGNSVLCLSVAGGNNYFFDLLNDKLLGVFEKPGAPTSNFQLLLKSPTDQIIYSCDQVFRFKEHKFQWVLEYVSPTVVYRISENLDFVAKLSDALIEVFNVETGMLSQNVVKDTKTPATFVSTKHSTAGINSYLVYIYQRSLHFEKLEPIRYCTKEIAGPKAYQWKKYFSDDGILCVHVGQEYSSFLLELYFSKDNYSFRKHFVRRFEFRDFSASDHAVRITKNKLVIFYYRLRNYGSTREQNMSSGCDEHCLIACDAKSRLEIQIGGIPYEKISSRKYETDILLVQTCQKLILDYGHELSIYTVEEFPLLGKIRLQLLYNFSFRAIIGRPVVVLDPNFENLIYIFSEGVRDEKVQFLDLSKNTGDKLTINCSERSENTAKKTQHLSTVLFPDKIIVGYRDSDTFYRVRAIPYKESGAGVENPVHVVPSIRLGWIVAQFPNGDLHIIESIKLKTLLVLHGFHPGCKFHIVDKNSKQVRIILFDSNPDLAFITINADSLTEYFKKGCLEKFKDWKVDRGQISSSILSLTEADISYSKYLNKSDKSLFEFHSSVGSPSEHEDYRPFCNLFLPVTNYTHSLLKVDNTQPCDLTKTWTVTIIAKKKKIKLFKKTIYTTTKRHSALVVEGIMHGGHFIIRAELTRPSNNCVKIECQSYRGKAKYEEIINKYYGKQIQVDPAKGLKLLKNIWVDTYNPQWKYDLRFHNCNTWIKKKLELLSLGNEFNAKPYRFFLSLPQDFNLREFKIKEH